MNGENPITCKDTTWLVSDSRERVLSAQEKASLDEHIAQCELCQGASKQFEVLFRQLDLLLGKPEQR